MCSNLARGCEKQCKAMKGPVFKTELAAAYPDCRLVVTKETVTAEGTIKIVCDLLKDKWNIVKPTFNSGVNAATAEFPLI